MRKLYFLLFIILQGGKHFLVFDRRNCANLISNMHIFTVVLASVKWILNYIITTSSLVLNGEGRAGGHVWKGLLAAPLPCIALALPFAAYL